MCRHQDVVAEVRTAYCCIVVRLVVEIPVGLGSDNVAAIESPHSGVLQSLIEPAVLLFPVAGTDSDWVPGIQTFDGKRLEFVPCGLVCLDEAFEVGGNGQPLGLGPFAKPSLQLRIDGNCHGLLSPQILRHSSELLALVRLQSYAGSIVGLAFRVSAVALFGAILPLSGQVSGRVVVGGIPIPEPAFVTVSCGEKSWAGYSDRHGDFIAVVKGGSSECVVEATIIGYGRGIEKVTAMARDVTVTIHPLVRQDGTSVSYSQLAAPMPARKEFQKGVESLQAGKWTIAEASFRKAIAAFPDYALAWDELGYVLEKLGKLPEASDAYSKALAIDGRLFSAYARRAVLESSQQHWDKVAATTDAAIKLDPFDWPDLFFYNAVAYFNLGRLELAEQSARRAIASDTGKRLPRAHYVLGKILAARGDYRGSVDEMSMYLDLLPGAADAASVRQEIRDSTSRMHL